MQSKAEVVFVLVVLRASRDKEEPEHVDGAKDDLDPVWLDVDVAEIAEPFDSTLDPLGVCVAGQREARSFELAADLLPCT